MRRLLRSALVCVLVLIVQARTAPAQSGSFTVLLGSDTVQIETFEQTGSRILGTVGFRSPAARFVRYVLELGADGSPYRYEQSIHAPDGTAMQSNAGNTTMVFENDSVSRSTWRGQEAVNDRMPSPPGTIPLLGASLSIPFAHSYLTYELAHAQARFRTGSGDSVWYTFGPAHRAPAATRVWLIASDSAEADYFGVARSGYRFDSMGRLLRSDWSGTTYKYTVTRGEPVDVEAIDRIWGTQDAAGAGFGRYLPRDSVRAELDGAVIWFAYGRPARRERTIWGGVVPWDRIWRLGADLATQFYTTVDLALGDATVPAGEYSLWMLPGEDETLLIVNRQTGQFGTQYDPARDLARVAVQRVPTPDNVERLTLSISEGTLRVSWGDVSYHVPVEVLVGRAR
jgi:hypothetical protein